jgi:signal transduction histidine kinase
MPQANSGDPSERAKVLVVDDTLANLIALQALIKTLGCDVVVASSGSEALQLASETDFALVLLDVMMPELNGFETLQRLRLLPMRRATPVIFMTAQSLERHALERAYELGAVDYIAKPVEARILLAKVRAFLDMFEQAQEIRRQAERLQGKDRYLGVLAHDLRTPLSVVAMTAAQLSDSTDPALQVAGRRLARAGLRMRSLSDDLLETARMALGALRVEARQVDLRDLLAELVADFAAVHPNVRIEVALPAQLQASGDPLRLQQAISNLLANAVNHGAGWVKLAASEADSGLRIDVVNECQVLTDAQIEALFAPFTLASRETKGAGLGLYIVREIARLHGGKAYGTFRDGRITFTLELNAPRA